MKEQDLDLIEQYYSNTSTKEERKAFEERKARDPDFAESVELYEVSQAIIQNNHRDRLVEDAQSYMNALESPSKARVSFFLNRTWQMAAAVLLIVTAVFLIRNLSSPTPEKIFAQQFEMPSPPNVRTMEANTNAQWEQAIAAYNAQQFENAINLMQELLQDNELIIRDRVHFYVGIAYLQNNQAAQAINHFQSVLSQSSYAQQAVWYTALTYIKLEDTEAAMKLLQTIVEDPNHYKRNAAQVILEQLK